MLDLRSTGSDTGDAPQEKNNGNNMNFPSPKIHIDKVGYGNGMNYAYNASSPKMSSDTKRNEESRSKTNHSTIIGYIHFWSISE